MSGFPSHVSFVVELTIEGATPEQGEAVEAACRQRNAWPIEYFSGGIQKRLFRKPRLAEPSLRMPEDIDGRHLLSDEADWDQRSWDLEPELRPKLAETFRILGKLIPQGFSFRAAWDGDEVRATNVLTAEELAELAARSQINEYTLYVVPPAEARRGSYTD